MTLKENCLKPRQGLNFKPGSQIETWTLTVFDFYEHVEKLNKKPQAKKDFTRSIVAKRVI